MWVEKSPPLDDEFGVGCGRLEGGTLAVGRLEEDGDEDEFGAADAVAEECIPLVLGLTRDEDCDLCAGRDDLEEAEDEDGEVKGA